MSAVDHCDLLRLNSDRLPLRDEYICAVRAAEWQALAGTGPDPQPCGMFHVKHFAIQVIANVSSAL